MSTTAFTMTEGVLLAHALVARVAEQAGARVLFIKGPTATAVEVRPDRPSTDVDVLVDPASFEDVCAALAQAGWQRRLSDSGLRHASDLAFEHSAHFIHAHWPCDLDVHFSFPGFLAAEPDVFEALWATRTTTVVAGRPIPAPGVSGQALVVALHALRDPLEARSRVDLEHLISTTARWSAAGIRDLSRLAIVTGSSSSAGPFLRAVGASSAPTDAEQEGRLADWQARQQGFGPSAIWLVELRRSPWRSKPAVLRRALLPRPEYLVGSYLAASLSRGQLARLHLRRWGRGIVSLPGAVRRVSGLKHRS